jgi:8-oxo-dGTP pyrophosphatase MutT (NUDIX family)
MPQSFAAGKRQNEPENPVTRYQYQYAVLPMIIDDGHPQVMLITSRETRRWILPKGRPEKKRRPWQVAAQEAYEEAGLVGRVSTKAIGSYASSKRLRSGVEVPCTVRVFLFKVEKELDDWPERVQRERRWMSPGEAALLVAEPQLTQLLLEFSALWI